MRLQNPNAGPGQQQAAWNTNSDEIADEGDVDDIDESEMMVGGQGVTTGGNNGRDFDKAYKNLVQ